MSASVNETTRTGYTVIDNYSELNNYDYKGKSTFISWLDQLATPVKYVFGGKDVCLLSQTHREMGSLKKIATAVFSIFLFPIGITSFASLILKLATRPSTWEKKIVIDQTKASWEIIHAFRSAIRAQGYDAAIKNLQKQPEIVIHVYDGLLACITHKIDRLSPWKEITPLFALIESKDAASLVCHAVKIRLLNDCNGTCNFTPAEEIISFIQNALRTHSQAIDLCYKQLFDDILLFDEEKSLLFNIVKMDLANSIIASFEPLKTANQAELRSLFFIEYKKTKDRQDYLNVFNDVNSMTLIHRHLKRMYALQQNGLELQNNLNTLSNEKFISSQKLWLEFRGKIRQFHTDLNEFLPDDEGKKYVDAIKKCLDNMIKIVDIFLSDSLHEIRGGVEKLQNNVFEETNALEKLCNDQKGESSPLMTPLLKILSIVHHETKKDLLHITSKLYSRFPPIALEKVNNFHPKLGDES